MGYREVIEHLEVQRHTRQLAKRQNTWFRSLSECRFVPILERLVPAEIAERIAKERLDAN